MADNEEGEQTNSRGNEWEVVTLTASAYAASPGPDGVESIHEDKNNNNNGSEAETSQPLFMSGHFVFPPNEHENLPIHGPDFNDPENVEIQKEEKEAEQIVTGSLLEDESLSELKGDEKFDITGLSVPEVLHSIYDDNSNKLSIHGPDFNEDKASTEASAKFSSFSGATTMGGSIYDENVSSNLPSPSELSLDPSDGPHSEDKAAADDNKLPPEAWWKRQVSSLCAHAKETNTFWSIFIAAAVMGLVILGKQWQQERWQVLQQRWHVNINAEKPGKMLGPLSRFKDIFIGQRTSHVRNALAAER